MSDKEKLKSLYDLWNSRGVYQKSDYEKFQEWLDNCPVKIREYDDYTDTIQVQFEIELEPDEEYVR